jgi:molecular chaperone IbpA
MGLHYKNPRLIGETQMTKSFVPAFFSQDIFKDFDKVFVGFDDQFKRLQTMHDDLTKDIPNYPPFNVRKDGNTYTIEIAVAGFATNEIDVTIDGGKLIVKGNAQSADADEAADYLFKGIATRAFTRAWAIGDSYEVKDAELFNGILKIALDKLVPEEQKAKKVPVKSKSEKQFLQD